MVKRTVSQNNAEWIDIKGYEGLYQINKNGQVKSLSRIRVGRNARSKKDFYFPTKERALKSQKSSSGYFKVSLSRDGKISQKNIHRLLAEAFILNPNNLPQVNHINGDKGDNNLSNLEWCTASYNSKHAYDVIGIIPYGLGRYGEESNKSRRVIQKTEDGKVIREWGSGMDAVREGFDSSCICRCCKGEAKTHKGYRWEYA